MPHIVGRLDIAMTSADALCSKDASDGFRTPEMSLCIGQLACSKFCQSLPTLIPLCVAPYLWQHPVPPQWQPQQLHWPLPQTP